MEFFDGLDLHENQALHNNIHPVAAVDDSAFVLDREGDLPESRESRTLQFIQETHLIGGFEKPWAEVPMDFDGGTENPSRQVFVFKHHTPGRRQ